MSLNWSSRWLDRLFYVGYRSRGFAYRTVCNLLLQTVEILALAFIAGTGNAKWSAGFFVVNLALSAIMDGFSQAIRGSLIYRRTISKKIILQISFGVWFLGYLGMSALIWRNRLEMFSFPVGILLVSRATMSLVEILIAGFTVDIMSRRRIFVHPLSSFVTLFFGSAFAALGVFVSGMSGFLILVGGYTLTRCANDFYLLACAKRSDRPANKQSTRKPKGSPEEFSVLRWEDLKRLALVASHSAFPLFLLMSSGGTGVFLFKIWFTKSILDRLLLRTFRANLVDLYTAISLKQWPAAGASVRASMRISLIALTVVVLALPWAGGLLSAPLPLSLICWLAVASLNRILVLGLGSIGLDLDVGPAYLVGRFAALPVLFLCFEHWLGFSAGFTAVIVLELGLAAWSMRYLAKINLVERMEYLQARETLEANENLEHFPEVFIMAYKLLLPTLKRWGIPHRLYVVRMHRSLRSEKAQAKQLEELRSKLRSCDFCVPLEANVILVCAVGTQEDADVLISQRLLMAFPYEIDEVKPFAPEMLIDRYFGSKDAKVSIPWAEVSNAKILPQFLHLQMLEHYPSIQGKWWTLSERGTWQSIEGPADPVRNMLYFSIGSKNRRTYSLSKSGLQKERSGDEVHYLLSPFGKLTAAFSTISATQEQRAEAAAMMRNVKAQILHSFFIDSPSFVQKLSAFEMFGLERIFKRILKRWHIEVRIQVCRGNQRVPEPGEIVLAESTDGAGSKLFLCMSKPTKVASRSIRPADSSTSISDQTLQSA